MREAGEAIEGVRGRQSARAGRCLTRLALSATALLLWWCADAYGFDVPRGPVPVSSRAGDLWLFLPFGYLLTVLIETPVLLFGLPRAVSFKQRLFAGLWLTACTYPVVVLVLPVLLDEYGYGVYLLVAETFAPVAECALFWLVFRGRVLAGARTWARSFAAIIVANLLSFILGLVLIGAGLLG